MGSDPRDDDQVPPLARGGRRVPLSADPDLRAGVDSRRDRDLDPAAVAAAFPGRRRHGRAAAGASPCRRRPRTGRPPADPMQADAHRTSLADRAGLGRPAAGAAGRAAGRTRLEARQLDLHSHAPKRLVELELHRVVNVLAARGGSVARPVSGRLEGLSPIRS